MLSARTPLGEDEDYISQDADMVRLLQQGGRSPGLSDARLYIMYIVFCRYI